MVVATRLYDIIIGQRVLIDWNREERFKKYLLLLMHLRR